MADPQNPAGGDLTASTEPVPTPWDFQRALYGAQDSDPEYAKTITAAQIPGFARTPKPPSAVGKLFTKVSQSLGFRSPKGLVDLASQGPLGQLNKDVAKGVIEAGRNTMAFATETALSISKATGLAEASRTPEEFEAFSKWWERGADPEEAGNPLLINAHETAEWFGEAPNGVHAVIEGLAQFGAGFLAAGGPAKTLLGNAAQGALIDFTAFDPEAARLSNLLENYAPEALKPIAGFLAAKEDDSRWEGRVKNALEGLVVGAVVDVVWSGLKRLKAVRDYRAGTINKDEAEAVIRGEMEKAKAAKDAPRAPEDFVTVIPVDEGFGRRGRFKVVPNTSADALAQRSAKQAANAPKVPGPAGVEAPELGAPLPARPDPLDHPNLVAQLDNIAAKHEHGALNGKVLKPAEESLEGLPPVEVEVSAGTPKDPTVLTEGEGSLRAPQDLAAHKVADEPLEAVFETPEKAQMAAASINTALKNEAREVLDYTPETLEAWKKATKDLTGLSDELSVKQWVEDTGFNPKYAQQPSEIQASVRAFVNEAGEAVTGLRNRVITNAETLKHAENLFGPGVGEKVLAYYRKLYDDTAELHVAMVAGRAHTMAQLKSAVELAKRADLQPGNPVAAYEALRALNAFAKLYGEMTGIASNVGRALQSQQVGVGEASARLFQQNPEGITKALGGAGEDAAEALSKSTQEAAAEAPKARGADAPPVDSETVGHRAPKEFNIELIEGLTKEEQQALLRHASMTKDPEGLMKMFTAMQLESAAAKATNATWATQARRAAFSFRVEAMLSSPRTHATNIASNALIAIQRPVEMGLMGLNRTLGGNPKAGLADAREGWDTVVGYAMHSLDSLKLALESYYTGKNILDPGFSLMSETTRTSSLGEAGVSFLKDFAPSRALMAEDEFFKQLNYRANTRASLLRYIRQNGITDKAQIKRILDDGMATSINPRTGQGIRPEGLQFARENTLSGEMGKGTWGDKFQMLAADHPTFDFIMPFRRTPVNAFRYTWERTPGLNLLNKTFREDLAAGGARRAQAWAKMEMGVMVYGLAAYWASTGLITGRGPSDPVLNAQWKAAGNQPYSFRVGDKLISFRRADPVFSALGLVADAHSFWGELKARHKDNLGAAMLSSVTANVASKSFMQGVIDFADLLSSENPNAGSRFIGTAVGSFIPAFVSGANGDDILRETRGVLDELSRRSPWHSRDLEPELNIFGEEIHRPAGAQEFWNPFTVSVAPKDDEVQQQLAHLGKRIPMPETKLLGLLDLTDRERYGKDHNGQSPYFRMRKIMGELGVRKAVEDAVSKGRYQNLPDDDAFGPGGRKHAKVLGIIKRYESKAGRQLMKEYPTLKKDYKLAKKMIRVGKREGGSAVDIYEDLLDGEE